MLHDKDLKARVATDALAKAARVAATHADAVDREGRYPAEAIAALREGGLLGSMRC